MARWIWVKIQLRWVSGWDPKPPIALIAIIKILLGPFSSTNRCWETSFRKSFPAVGMSVLRHPNRSKEQSSKEEHYGIRVNASSFSMFCPDEDCLLHESIGIGYDDDLYKRPPSLLLGTIDKFASDGLGSRFEGRFWASPKNEASYPLFDRARRTPFDHRAARNDRRRLQAAIDTTISQSGVRPKYIAATATIQRAEDQIPVSLHARPSCFPRQGSPWRTASSVARTVKHRVAGLSGQWATGCMAPLLL